MRPRVIPCLTLMDGGLYRTQRFTEPRYVGDATNAIRIFNAKEVDELFVLDMTRGATWSDAHAQFLEELATEAFMPLAYGGRLRTLAQVENVFRRGFEKVCLNTAAVDDPRLVKDVVARFGGQAVIASIDVARRGLLGRRNEVVTRCGTHGTGLDPVAHARAMEAAGVGEILLTAVDRDGSMKGYDLDLVRAVAAAVTVPVVACGGAGSLEHFKAALDAGAEAVAAGSFFVFQGRHRAVLIRYPQVAELEAL